MEAESKKKVLDVSVLRIKLQDIREANEANEIGDGVEVEMKILALQNYIDLNS
jgi:hypothetical protein